MIAELGINHGGSIEVAKQLIDSAASAGVDAVKFQTYLTEKRAPKGNQIVFDILKKCELPFEAFAELKEYSSQYDVEFFSTPFDIESVEYLESINCDLYKVASFDVVNHKLLSTLAQTCKPIVMSVGMATLDEITKAYEIVNGGTDKITLLHCVSAYPTKAEDANLSAISTLKKNFGCVIGQSDHTDGIEVPLYAAAAGAQVIEKHFKIDDKMECIDSPVSITEKQMAEMVRSLRHLEQVMGDGSVCLSKSEEGAKIFRRHSN